MNPALSVRGERYAVVEGKTPEISVPQARTLLGSIDTSTVVGRRDRAMLAILVYTSSRAGAVETLKRGSFYRAGDQSMLHFEEKAASPAKIPVRHDLETVLFDYLDGAGLRGAPKDAALSLPPFERLVNSQRARSTSTTSAA